jgi:hypothetical protein
LSVGGAGYVRSVDVVRPFGTDVEMRIGWIRAEQFVIVHSTGAACASGCCGPKSRR